MSFSDRIKMVIDNEGFNSNNLSKKLGYPRSQTVYNIINGKVFPSFDFLYRLFSTKEFDKYDPVWLITGRGEMLKKGISEKNETIMNESKPEYSTDILKEKEKRIEDLQGQIEFLKKLIEDKI